jgi:undecaprenyl diphosphate synthase
MNIKDNINLKKLPEHIAIIMDGNGRWAQKKGKKRIFGHKNGVASVKEITEASAEIGIKYLTLYVFSTENWKRPKYEVNALMNLLVTTINKEIDTLNNNNIRLLAIGDLKSLPKNCNKKLMQAIKSTSNNTQLTLIFALSYSSRCEIVNATKNIAQKIKNNEISINDINQNLFESFLSTSSIPDPDLLIRTSGEYRISNFLLWQIAYSELYFTKKLWPDFRKEDLYKAIIDYQKRERRFGKISKQIN